MKKRVLIALVVIATVSFAVGGGQANNSQGLTPAQIAQFAAQGAAAVSVLDPPLDPSVDPPGNLHAVSVHTFDPAHTGLVGGEWVKGTGCPANQPVATYPATSPTGTFSDSVCKSGDPSDQSNWGLLLTKTGPTSNNASMEAELHNPKGITLTELGYDIRSLDYPQSVSGSHCGAGAPRFDVVTTTGFFFVGCRSPLADSISSGVPGSGDGWTRLRWGALGVVMGFCFAPTPTTACPVNFALVPITGTVQRIVIVFDEGTDTGADFFGAAILDNIDVNGQLVGHT
jgi:hypothetical protein